MRFVAVAAVSLLCSSTSLGAQTPAPSDSEAPPAGNPATETAGLGVPLTRVDLEAWLDGFMPMSLQSADIAGAVVVAVKDGSILLQKGYGFADAAQRTPVDPESTLFRPGSVGKLFTWTAVMQQVEQGKLDLDADINGYLDFRIPDRGGKPITLRNIMTHTPGFEDKVKNLMGVEEGGPPPLDRYLKAWTPMRIYPPGITPAYSNYGAALAGYIVARVSGQSFDDYVERFIFAPLQMRRSTFRQPLPAHLAPQMSRGYRVASEPPQPFEMVGPAPAGSLSATGGDMGRFMIAHLQNGRYGDERILRADTAELMHRRALTILPRVNRMLLGFYEADDNARRVIAHAGDTQWFHSDLRLFVDDGVGLYVSMNSLGKDGAAGRIRAALFEQFADRYLPGADARGGVEPAMAAEHARMLAGSYSSSGGAESNFLSLLGFFGRTQVAANADGTITVPAVTDAAGVPVKWREIAPFVWRELHGGRLLSASVENGRVTRFGFEWVSPFMVYDRAAGSWLLLVFGAGMFALLVNTLAWPTAALVRRHYHAPYPLSGRSATLHAWVRIAGLAILLTWVAWGIAFSRAVKNLGALTSASDAMFWSLQLMSAVVFSGAAVIGLWNAWQVVRSGRTWYAKAWAVALGIAVLTVLWVALAYRMIAFDVNY